MFFLIDTIDKVCHVLVYQSLIDLTQRIEWQDVFEGQSIIIDENGIEYEWDSSKKEEVGIVYNYTLIPTDRTSKLLRECLNELHTSRNKQEFNFKTKEEYN
ncbi:hypothetical protein [Flavobacterium sp. J27]|uniref:hypothetical protein n=1 Tax=Flavobacterium sp. J27 TaxID=2060419 RepID=UPI00102FED78|nr:hypothetical protein [Flavobacterium sp. J27]